MKLLKLLKFAEKRAFAGNFLGRVVSTLLLILIIIQLAAPLTPPIVQVSQIAKMKYLQLVDDVNRAAAGAVSARVSSSGSILVSSQVILQVHAQISS